MLRHNFDRIRRTYSAFALQSILSLHKGCTTLLFAPSLSWNKGLFQRPQQLARALARQGALVFYMEPELSRKSKPFYRLEERLYVCNVSPKVFQPILRPLVYLLTWNRAYRAEFNTPRILYDFVDNLEVFGEDPEKIRLEHERLLKDAHLVITTANRLQEEAQRVRSKVLLSQNGVDYPHFASARQFIKNPPKAMRAVLSFNKPIIGYYGAFAHWFDYELYEAVARMRPDLSFVLIGPDYDGSLKNSRLLEQPNVIWLGSCVYKDLPSYLSCFAAATIPFKLNSITHATSPLKLFEYMAGGKPVVVTPMEECLRYEGVLAGADPKNFSNQLDEALRLRESLDYRHKIDEVARANTWQARAKSILTALAEADSEF
jgi:glycosyltransferase involved in cell wall biosynthesis